MPSKLMRLMLFISSYLPLLIIIGVLNYGRHKIASLVLVELGLVSFLCLSLHLRHVKEYSPATIRVDKVHSRDADSVNYVVTYIVPFIATQFDTAANMVALGILFLLSAKSI